MAVLSATGLFLALTSAAATEPLPVREVARSVYLYQGQHDETSPDNQGGIANIGFIVGGETVAVIDIGGSVRQVTAFAELGWE